MDIEKIKEKEYNIKEALKQHFEDEIASDVGICSYLIFPDGTLIGGYAHRDFFDYLINNSVLTTEEVGEYDTDIFNTLFNCVRCTDLENENYIGLPTNRLTEEQFKALKEWLENNFELGRKEILVTANFKKENEAGVTYNYTKIIEDGDWPSDYIINRIKRYYSSGKLVEDIKAEIEEDVIIDKIKSLLPKYGHPVYFDNNNNLMIDKALDALFNFMSDQWSVWVGNLLVDNGSLPEMLDKFLEMIDRVKDRCVELCAGNVEGFMHTYLVSDPNNYLFVREDIEEVGYDNILTPSEEENHTWKIGLEQLMVLKDWQDKYYNFAKGPGVYRLNYEGIIRRLNNSTSTDTDSFEIKEASLVRKSEHYSEHYSTIIYGLIIDDVVSDVTHSFTLVSLDVNNLAAILCKWDEPQHSPYIQESFDKLDSICKLEEMLGLGNYTKNKMEEMVEYFKHGAAEVMEHFITEDVEEKEYEEPIYCVTISAGNETIMGYLLNEEFKLRLINNGLLDDYYINGVGFENLLAVDWLYFVSTTPENSVMHNQILIPALHPGIVGQRNLYPYMKPEQIIYVSEFPRKLVTSWPIKEDIEEEPYNDKYMSLINLQVISDYAADHLDGGGWIWKDYGIIGVDNPMAGPYIAGIFKATDDPNKVIRYDLDSIPEDILSDEELSYMNPEETDIDEYVPNLMYALESKNNHTITDIINKIEANASQETMTLKAALNFIEEYWGTDEELDSWIKDTQEYHLNNAANYLNIVEKLNEDIKEEPYIDYSGVPGDMTLIKTAYDIRTDERYWIWEMPADVLNDIAKKYDTHNYKRFDQRFYDFESLVSDPDYSWRIKRVVTDVGTCYMNNRHIQIAEIKYQYYCYCKPDHEVVNYRYNFNFPFRCYTGKQFDEQDLAELDKIKELDTLLGVPEKYKIDNLIEQINEDRLDLYEDIKEKPTDIGTSNDNIIEVTKFTSSLSNYKYKYRNIYYDINLNKTELVDYLLDLYMGLHLENGDPEEEIEEDIKLIRDRVKNCVLYIDYKPEDIYSLGIYDPEHYNTLNLIQMPKNIAEKIIGDKLVTNDLIEDIKEVPPTNKDFFPEYASKYLNWDKDTEGRKNSIELINNHWNDKIWFLTVGGNEKDLFSPRRYMTFVEAYNEFVSYDKFGENDCFDDFIQLNINGYALSHNEISKNWSCILFRSREEPIYTPDRGVVDINEDIKEIPLQSDVDVDPINNSYIYSIFNNYASCECNEDVKNIVTRDRAKKRWYIKYFVDIWDDGEIITKELMTFDEAFKISLDLPFDSTAYALICTDLTEEEKRIINRGRDIIEPFYITYDRFNRYLFYLGEVPSPY